MIQLTKATLNDVQAMLDLVEEEVKSGLILHRDADEISTNIRSYVLAKIDNTLIGYTALHIHSEKLAEIRSLVVHELYRGQGVGQKMVLYVLEEAVVLGLKEILSLTYVADFFLKLGFNEIAKESIPEQKIWADCIKCIHFPVCNEVALLYHIDIEDHR